MAVSGKRPLLLLSLFIVFFFLKCIPVSCCESVSAAVPGCVRRCDQNEKHRRHRETLLSALPRNLPSLWRQRILDGLRCTGLCDAFPECVCVFLWRIRRKLETVKWCNDTVFSLFSRLYVTYFCFLFFFLDFGAKMLIMNHSNENIHPTNLNWKLNQIGAARTSRFID